MEDLSEIVNILWAFRVPIGIGVGTVTIGGGVYAYRVWNEVAKSMQGDELPVECIGDYTTPLDLKNKDELEPHEYSIYE